MQHRVNETLEYVISLAVHVRRGDISTATLTVLIELGFQTHVDGFVYLRKALQMRCDKADMRLSDIYREIADACDISISSRQIEQAIITAIDLAWQNRDNEKWSYFFREEFLETKPSNKVFIAQLACFLELWRDCC